MREPVELYEGSGGTQGTTLPDTELSVIVMINRGNKTGAIRKTPLIRVKDGAASDPVCIYNLRAAGDVEVRDETEVHTMRVREAEDDEERARLWKLSAAPRS